MYTKKSFFFYRIWFIQSSNNGCAYTKFSLHLSQIGIIEILYKLDNINQVLLKRWKVKTILQSVGGLLHMNPCKVVEKEAKFYSCMAIVAASHFGRVHHRD